MSNKLNARGFLLSIDKELSADYYLAGFNHLSSQLKNVRCHNTPFCGFSTQWFSSGKISIWAGTPRSFAALNAAIACDAKIR